MLSLSSNFSKAEEHLISHDFHLLRTSIIYEEAFLERELEGYGDYMKRVKYRLIPFVW